MLLVVAESLYVWFTLESTRDNMKKKGSEMFEKSTGDAEGVEKGYFRTIRKW